MRKLGSIARKLCGLTLALGGLFSTANGQNGPTENPSWSSFGPTAATYSVAIHPQNPNTVYAGADGVLMTTDGGASWRNTGLGGDAVVALVIDRFNPNTVYAAIAFRNYCYHSFRRLLKSTDGGASWSDAVSPPINGCDNIYALAMDPLSSNTLYVADYDDFGDTWAPLIKSTDGGASWAAPSFNPPFAALAVNPLDPKTLYAGTFDFTYFGYQGLDDRNGVLKSTDGGVSWGVTGLTKTGVETLAIDPINPNTIYAVARGFYSEPLGLRGLFKSTDAGASWLTINNGLERLLGSVSPREGLQPAPRASLVIDPDNPKTIYAGFPAGGGVLKSADAGASWQDFSDGLNNKNVRALALAPGNPNTLYAATAGGLFRITDHAATMANPIDDPQLFVRQHYVDFLNREPDSGGLGFWTNEITSCGTDTQCIEVKRINVSAAFFLSIEFQETGYLVYRIYKSAFGTLPPAPVPIRFTEFVKDSQQIGKGVQVGIGDWQTQLENGKQAFALDFVQRMDFQTAYPSTLTAEQFVDQLNTNAGAVLSITERSNLIGLLTTPTDFNQRAQVLRAVAEDGDLRAAEFNKAFVLMQYFGYLRRNPNDAPDTDYSGFNFWLDKLNSFGGNFVNAEMVKAFIVSGEYRQRFGP